MTTQLEGALPSPQANPANPPARRVTEENRIPMSLPQLKLQVPEIPGWHLHWFLSKNVRRALRAGYEFVSETEVEVNSLGLADAASSNGNSDMGSNISVIAGGLTENGTDAEKLYLMKLPQAWRDKDVAKLEEANEQIAASIRGGAADTVSPTGAPQSAPGDSAKRYLKAGQDLLFPRNNKIRR